MTVFHEAGRGLVLAIIICITSVNAFNLELAPSGPMPL